MYEDEPILTFKRQVKLVALGALIGFIPAFANTLLQNRFQRQDIVFARRLTLIQGLSSVNEKVVSILARAETLQRRVDSLAKGTFSAQDVRDIDHQMTKIDQDSLELDAEFRTQTAVLGALDKGSPSLPGYESQLTPFSPTRPKGGKLAKIHDQLETTKAQLVQTTGYINHICNDIADNMDK